MSASPTITDDITAVSEVPKRIIAAWAANDADAFAEVFTEDATMVLPGVFVSGRDGIRGYMAGAYAGPLRGTRVAGEPISVRFTGADGAILVTRGGALVGDETQPAPERAVHATWVLAKQDGRWLLTAYHNAPANAV
ncbi:SgcJ/EcaC family oxidoreductase [Streptosporangium sp. NPDC048047]|uniref:SgcJ/EcaC family oxidoreductase n=1 Tax=unclassified Streptosporangium TaxID=2632669 RepID=UPI003443C943